MKAFLKNYHQSPRKVRLVADLIKGKPVSQAMAELDFLSKRAASPLKKLVKSAIANAKNNFQADPDNLYIKSLTVDKGNIIKRFRPVSRGRAFPVRKKMSHVKIVLEVKDQKPQVKQEKPKVENTKSKSKSKKNIK